MKRFIFISTSLLIILACFSVAIIEYNNHKITVAASQTSQVQTALNTMKLHDAVNAKNLEIANNATAVANQKRLTICNIIKTTKTVYDPSLCQ